jgi:hypothetical protein
VNSGSGSGSYASGKVVTITANAAPSGQVFNTWVINAGSPAIANVNAASTTLTMPSSAVTVTATYKPTTPTALLTMSKSTYAANEPIVVSYAGLPGNAKDWIGLFKAGASNTQYGQWFYTNGAKSGTMTFNGLVAGSYEARLFYNDSYTSQYVVSFYVSGGTPTLQNVVLPANGGTLLSFTSQYGSGWLASDLTDGITTDDGWSSAANPGPQAFVYSFKNGGSAKLQDAVIYSGKAEGTYFSKGVEVWASADGTNFSRVATGTLANAVNSIKLSLGNVVAKKVKLVITSGYRTDYWELGEFVVNGTLQ